MSASTTTNPKETAPRASGEILAEDLPGLQA